MDPARKAFFWALWACCFSTKASRLARGPARPRCATSGQREVCDFYETLNDLDRDVSHGLLAGGELRTLILHVLGDVDDLGPVCET